jgi:hypothetical protein
MRATICTKRALRAAVIRQKLGELKTRLPFASAATVSEVFGPLNCV